jgi:hypothetical protein
MLPPSSGLTSRVFLGRYQSFRGSYFLHLQGWSDFSPKVGGQHVSPKRRYLPKNPREVSPEDGGNIFLRYVDIYLQVYGRYNSENQHRQNKFTWSKWSSTLTVIPNYFCFHIKVKFVLRFLSFLLRPENRAAFPITVAYFACRWEVCCYDWYATPAQ